MNARDPKTGRLTGCLALFLGWLAGCGGSGKPGAMDQAGYHVRKGVVFYLASWTSEAFVVEGADASTLESPLPGGVATGYARDARRVYWNGRAIPQADAPSFRILDPRFARDARNVYLAENVVCDDADRFQVVSAMFVKNSRAVYGLDPLQRPPEERVVSTDVAGFRRLAEDSSALFHADSRQLLAGKTRMEGVDPAEFRHLGSSYWRDERRGYYFDRAIDGADPATLRGLPGGYGLDRDRVYYLGKVLEGADPATFEVTDPRWPKAKDARRSYSQGAIER